MADIEEDGDSQLVIHFSSRNLLAPTSSHNVPHTPAIPQAAASPSRSHQSGASPQIGHRPQETKDAHSDEKSYPRPGGDRHTSNTAHSQLSSHHDDSDDDGSQSISRVALHSPTYKPASPRSATTSPAPPSTTQNSKAGSRSSTPIKSPLPSSDKFHSRDSVLAMQLAEEERHAAAARRQRPDANVNANANANVRRSPSPGPTPASPSGASGGADEAFARQLQQQEVAQQREAIARFKSKQQKAFQQFESQKSGEAKARAEEDEKVLEAELSGRPRQESMPLSDEELAKQLQRQVDREKLAHKTPDQIMTESFQSEFAQQKAHQKSKANGVGRRITDGGGEAHAVGGDYSGLGDEDQPQQGAHHDNGGGGGGGGGHPREGAGGHHHHKISRGGTKSGTETGDDEDGDTAIEAVHHAHGGKGKCIIC